MQEIGDKAEQYEILHDIDTIHGNTKRNCSSGSISEEVVDEIWDFYEKTEYVHNLRLVKVRKEVVKTSKERGD